MRLCGIDPMDHGALAIMDTSDCNRMQITDMPTVKTKGNRFEVDVPALWDIIMEGRIDKVYIEKMQAMAKGGNANFKRGGYLYMFRAIFTAAKISFVEVPPKEWQKRFGIKGINGDPDATKEQSYLIASRLFPLQDFKTERGRTLDGRSDAALITEFGRAMELGNGK